MHCARCTLRDDAPERSLTWLGNQVAHARIGIGEYTWQIVEGGEWEMTGFGDMPHGDEVSTSGDRSWVLLVEQVQRRGAVSISSLSQSNARLPSGWGGVVAGGRAMQFRNIRVRRISKKLVRPQGGQEEESRPCLAHCLETFSLRVFSIVDVFFGTTGGGGTKQKRTDNFTG